MVITREEKGIRISEHDDFDPVKIFECGQCFRWNADETGTYHGVAFGKNLSVSTDGDDILMTCSVEEYESIWREYFDMDRDYASIRASLCIDDYMKICSDFGAGIRLLRQEKWEALCSFIISQCNNIPRIKKIVETLCSNFGEEKEFDGAVYYTFPTAERVALLDESDLAPLRCGYRAPYILGAARKVYEGELNLDELAAGDCGVAMTALKSLEGVGDKVASCAMLFGLGKLDAFPVDVWMRRALGEHYGKNFDPGVFGQYAGLAQQYIFYYSRENGT